MRLEPWDGWMPKVGELLRVQTIDPHRHLMASYVSKKPPILQGRVVKSDSLTDPDEFELYTGNRAFPQSSIKVSRVEWFEPIDSLDNYKPHQQPTVHRRATQEQGRREWQVESSKGDRYYTVVYDPIAGWSCECPGFQFRRNCRHIKEKKQEIQDG